MNNTFSEFELARQIVHDAEFAYHTEYFLIHSRAGRPWYQNERCWNCETQRRNKKGLAKLIRQITHSFMQRSARHKLNRDTRQIRELVN